MTTDEQLQKLKELHKSIMDFINEVEGFYATDHGHHPTSLVNATHRFQEAVWWTKLFIERNAR